FNMTEKKNDDSKRGADERQRPVRAGGGSGDLADQAAGALTRFSQELSKASPTQQAIAGGGSGCLTGYLFGRIGRTAALAVGGGLICLSLAQQRGLISVNWRRVEQQARQAVDEVADAAGENVIGNGGNNLQQVLERAKQVLAAHRYFAATFAGGFLVGLAAS
ncbi:hypothetical protein BOX15_Mlig014707g2, partial [Macrostomum lignano]